MRLAAAAIALLCAGCEQAWIFVLEVETAADQRDASRLHVDRAKNHADCDVPVTSNVEPDRIEVIATGFRVVYPLERYHAEPNCFRVWYDIDGDGAHGASEPSWWNADAITAKDLSWTGVDRVRIPVRLQ